MTRVLFLHHQQRRHFKEEPGYNEVFSVFKAAGEGLELREFVYQTILSGFVDLEYARAAPDKASMEAIIQAWLSGNARFQPILEQVLEIERPDVVVNICSFPFASIHPQMFQALRARGHRFKVVSVFWDMIESEPANVGHLKLCLEHGDLVLLGDDRFAYLRLIAREGVYAEAPNVERALWLPFVVDPSIFRPLDLPKTRDVVLFGSSEGRRVDLIRDLSAALGPAFAHLGGYMAGDTFLPREDYVHALNTARIVVNTQTVPERDQIKGRIKEALSCGAFLLEQDAPNARWFLEGSGVVLFADAPDAIAKIRHYLDRPEERARIAAASRDWLLARHSPRAYVDAVMGALGV